MIDAGGTAVGAILYGVYQYHLVVDSRQGYSAVPTYMYHATALVAIVIVSGMPTKK